MLTMTLRLGPAATNCNEVLVVVKLNHSEVFTMYATGVRAVS